jgi:hypothetical protein
MIFLFNRQDSKIMAEQMERRIPFSASALSKIKNQTYVTKITSKNIGSLPALSPPIKSIPPKKALFSLKNEPTRATPERSTPLRG